MLRSTRNNKYGSISDAVYEKVFDQIVSGKLRLGQKITEQEFAQSEGISRAPVREAFKRLAEDRLIVLIPRSRCHVCEPTVKDIAELYDIRKRLEGLALEYAFARFNLDKVRNLRSQFESCLALTGAQFAEKELALDSKLHSLISATSGSACLQDLLAKIAMRIQMFRTRGADVNAHASEALKTHLEILDSILAGDQPRALDVLHRHIDISKEHAIHALQRMDSRTVEGN